MDLARLLKPYRCAVDGSFRLADIDPDDTCGLDIEKSEAKEMLDQGLERLVKLQQKLYVANSWSVLAILQGMDASGKDGVIKHVMAGLNPQGTDVHPFRAPSEKELEHDFLWRAACRLPAAGDITIFNRSYYEDVLVVRVRPGLLEAQNLPAKLRGKNIWNERFEDINAFERHLTRSGTLVLKFFLHISKNEQKKRFLERIEDPAKNWKFAAGDVDDRRLWPQYMRAYEDMIRHTSTPHAPWFVVPSDHKWFARLTVAAALIDALERLRLSYPRLDTKAKRALATARRDLLNE